MSNDWSKWIVKKQESTSSEELQKSDSGQWKLQPLKKAEKGAANPKMGGSAFKQEHVNAVAGMKSHDEAKAHAHAAVDASSANPKNRAKMKRMIDSSKSSTHLAMGMQNHILAHQSEGLKVI